MKLRRDVTVTVDPEQIEEREGCSRGDSKQPREREVRARLLRLTITTEQRLVWRLARSISARAGDDERPVRFRKAFIVLKLQRGNRRDEERRSSRLEIRSTPSLIDRVCTGGATFQ